jgi:hypothetical protein
VLKLDQNRDVLDGGMVRKECRMFWSTNAHILSLELVRECGTYYIAL